MKWFKRLSVGVCVLLAMLVVLPFLIPLNEYLPAIERQVSARLGEPVKISDLHLAVLPQPHLTVDGITVGKGGDIKVGKVTVTPALLSLLDSTKVINSLEIDGLVLTRKAIDKIPLWMKSDDKPGAPQQPQLVSLRSIRLDDALIKLDKASFGPFDAQIRLGGNNQPEQASIATKDGKLKVIVRPEKSNFAIDASAKAWKLPAGPAILFDELTIKGVATTNDANFSQISARLYGGSAVGKSSVSWRKGLQLNGNFTLSGVELRSLVPLLAPGKKMSGRLDAKPVFSAAAASAPQLAQALRLDTPFNVSNGVLYGVDIQKAATSLVKQGDSGGETRFEELSGQLAMDRGAYRFTRIKIASGSLAANGNVSVSSQKELSGRINAQVTLAGASANVPLNVSGTLDSPLLFPTGGTVAGAAVGTAILGPGLGTSVGAKVGGWAESLFGGKDDKK